MLYRRNVYDKWEKIIYTFFGESFGTISLKVYRNILMSLA